MPVTDCELADVHVYCRAPARSFALASAVLDDIYKVRWHPVGQSLPQSFSDEAETTAESDTANCYECWPLAAIPTRVVKHGSVLPDLLNGKSFAGSTNPPATRKQ